MSEDPGGGREDSSPYLRLPLPIVAGALAGFLVLVLAVGLFANRNLRPQTAVQPTPVAVVTPAPTSGSTLSNAQTESSGVATATVAAPTQVSTPTSFPTVLSTPTLRPTINPDLAQELVVAYQHYWQVRAEALLDLDTSHLPEVMAGEHLVSVEKFIQQLRSEGHALQTDIDHKYVIVQASEDDAEIADTYTDSSIYVDPASHVVLSQPTNDVLQEEYRMSRLDGSWRVVSLVRAP